MLPDIRVKERCSPFSADFPPTGQTLLREPATVPRTNTGMDLSSETLGAKGRPYIG